METKPAYKTSEFWLIVATNIAGIITTSAGLLPAKYSVPTLTLANSIYAVARGLAKSGVPAIEELSTFKKPGE